MRPLTHWSVNAGNEPHFDDNNAQKGGQEGMLIGERVGAHDGATRRCNETG
jgi:hypothetical protein